jgi:hypothetical protein
MWVVMAEHNGCLECAVRLHSQDSVALVGCCIMLLLGVKG